MFKQKQCQHIIARKMGIVNISKSTIIDLAVIPGTSGNQEKKTLLFFLYLFQTFSELSEYLVDAAAEQIVDDPNPKSRYRTSQNVLQKIVRLPLESVGSYITVGEYLRHLYEKDKLMDVAVHVKDRTFSAHRVALSCYSEYFAELFSRNKGRKIPFEMRLRGITPEAFAIFLEFVYTGRLKFVYTNQIN